MKIILFVYFAVFETALCVAQMNSASVQIISSPDNTSVMVWSVENAEVRDTTQISLVYRLDYVFDPQTKRTRTNQMALQIGATWSRYYSLIREVLDIKAARIRRQSSLYGFENVAIVMPTSDERDKIEAAGDKNMNGEVWIDRQNQNLIERYHSPLEVNQSIEYTESVPILDWNLSVDTMIICGYKCNRAETIFRGRKWSAWYTAEIPINIGPWKLGGLPGCILMAEDSEHHYIWTCVGIGQNREPIFYYTTNKTTLSRTRCIDFLKKFYEYPLETLSKGARLKVYSKGRLLDATWTIPYNPIERE